MEGLLIRRKLGATLKGYCHENFAAFSSKQWWNYDPEPLFKTRTLLQPQEEDIKGFSKGEQTSVFFLDISHSQWQDDIFKL